MRAIECLTQAVYYEAASEGVDGGRAVAQIILNRVRHRGYPNSICGVVYQGSTRATGCQFTFTCDGSLARTPLAYLWSRSRKIATDALRGTVFAPVGHATHYHADYVLPYWADSLDKVAVIGRHIFYRFRGDGGAARAFSQRYASSEPVPPPPPPVGVIEQSLQTVESGPENLPSPELQKVEEDRVSALELGPKIEVSPNSHLQADLLRGTLLTGEAAPPTYPNPKDQSFGECEKLGVRQTPAIGANNLQAGAPKASC